MAARNWQELIDFLTSKATDEGLLNKFRPGPKPVCPDDLIKLCYDPSNTFYKNNILKWMEQALSNTSQKKCTSKANELRTMGNKMFVEGDNIGSLKIYNECVQYAPESSTELALALGNRSAVLFHLEKYKECLKDIDIAILKGFPLPLQYKLHLRKSKCLNKLGQMKESVEALYLARKFLEHVDAPKSKIALLQNDIHTAVADALQNVQLDNASGTSQSSVTGGECSHQMALSYGENPDFAFASSALDLKYSNEKGRHVVANRDIKIGDTLYIEKPYAFVILPGQDENFCHQCCTTCIAPIPCWECSQATYCSEDCRQEAWKEHHQWECNGLELLHSVGIAHLGLRVLLKAGPLVKLLEASKSLGGSDCSVDQMDYRSKENSYPVVYRLMPHLEDMQPDDYFQYGLTALLLTLYLKEHTQYFKQCDSEIESNTSSELIIASLILRHIAQLVCNGHAITKLSKPNTENSVVTETQIRVATAIYPSASMMNHSCDPNIINSFNNQYLVVRASGDIPKDGEVYNCYGPHSKRMAFKDRQEILKKQYFFKCTCEPCSQPSDEKFEERFSALRCSLCSGPLIPSACNYGDAHEVECSDCGQSQTFVDHIANSIKAHQAYDNGCRELEDGNVPGALEDFRVCLDLRKECLYKSNRDLTVCIDQVAKCYAMLGDYEKSVEYLRQCLPAIQEQFGANSIELANELQKLTDVMLCDLQQQKPGTPEFIEKHKVLTDCVKNAHQILELYYGSWNTGFQEIVAKKQQLEQMMQ